MARVVFTSNLKQHVDCDETSATGNTVREVLDHIFAENRLLRGYVVDEHGRLRKHMAIFVNNQPLKDRVELSDAVSEDTEIYVMQALSGG